MIFYKNPVILSIFSGVLLTLSWPVQGLLRHFKDEIKKRNKFDPIVKENKNIPYLVDQHLLDKNA